MLTRPHTQRGFTLIETMAALLIFSLVTLGIVPLMLSSIRGSNLSRTATVAKNLVVEATERARGLPFRREVSGADGNPKRVDLLDLYFPRGFGGTRADGTYAANVFTVTCNSTSTIAACPKHSASDGTIQSAIPAGYSLTFTAEFVQPVAGVDGETYSTTTVPSTYYWQSGAAGPDPVCSTCSSEPPAELLRLRITASWTAAGLGNRSFSSTSILGNRRFAGLRIRGAASVEELVQMSTGFDSATEGDSSLVVAAGSAESDMEVRAVTRARYTGSAARLMLRDTEAPLVAEVDVEGASYAAESPPDFNVAVADPESAVSVSRSDLGASPVGGADTSEIRNAHGSVAIDLPEAGGTTDIAGSDPLGLLWLTTDLDTITPGNNPLRILDATRVAWLEALDGTSLTTVVDSTSTPTTTTPREVANVASGGFGNLRLFPTDFIPIDEDDEDDDDEDEAGGPVIEIQDFTAEVSCRATANDTTLEEDAASATWSATLRVWTDPEDGATSGGYTTPVTLDDSNAATVLTGIGNPLVFEEPNDPESGLPPEAQGRVPQDIFLFPETRSYDLDGDPNTDPTTVTHPGYLSSWTGIAGSVTADADRRVITAALDGAFRLESEPLNPSVPLSSVSVKLATLNCESVDLRP